MEEQLKTKGRASMLDAMNLTRNYSNQHSKEDSNEV